jgi:phosphate transport system permease protein
MTNVSPQSDSGAQDTATETTPRPRTKKLRTPLSAYGEPMVWLTGGSLAVGLAMVVGLILLILWMGLVTFWPPPVEKVVDDRGRIYMGEVTRSGWFTPSESNVEGMSPEVAAAARAQMDANDGMIKRRLFRTGNYDLTNTRFEWVDDVRIQEGSVEFPEWAIVVERMEWGRFYGFPEVFRIDGEVTADTEGDVWAAYHQHHDQVRDRRDERRALEKHDLGRLSRKREEGRLRLREVEIELELPRAWAVAYEDLFWMDHRKSRGDFVNDEIHAAAKRRVERFEQYGGAPPAEIRTGYHEALEEYAQLETTNSEANARILAEIDRLAAENARYEIVFRTARDEELAIPLDQIVRAYPANQLGTMDKVGVYLSRWWEYLTDEPREANSEGGVFPAIVGTVLMTIIMAVLVVPFGVMAALYLREYAKGGPIVSAVRIAINNLAGVPSIVFGVFGLGFFCYGVGGFIDGGPSYVMPRPAWFTLLATLAVVSVLAFVTLMASLTKPGTPVTPAKRMLRYVSGFAWLIAAVSALILIATTPFFDGFFRAGLPNPTFGKGALVWASFTLALLTLPVVIVATEEALAAVPNSMREGSYACGASKWQTIKRIVLPRAMPGIMTGTILAMARGAGEVAPLMLVGAVKLAPELPIAMSPAEHFGINRSFMHLGFHIFDLGFQSPDSEAAKPLVFTTTLLLITIVAVLNISAVFLRTRLRRKFVGAQF